MPRHLAGPCGSFFVLQKKTEKTSGCPPTLTAFVLASALRPFLRERILDERTDGHHSPHSLVALAGRHDARRILARELADQLSSQPIRRASTRAG